MEQNARPPASRALWGWCWFVLFWASVVLFLGANVTTTQSGDATPDWPRSWGSTWSLLGQLLELPDKLRNELSHRYGVPFLGVAALVLVIWAWVRQKSPGVKRLGLWAVGLLVAQAVLGGLRVKEWQFAYSAETAAASHAVLAEVFFCTLVGLLAVLAPSRPTSTRALDADAIALLRRALLTFALIGVQIVLGALGRHNLVPREVHAMFALAVVPVTIRLVLSLMGDTPRDLHYLRRPGAVLGALIMAQVALGIWTYLEKPHIDTMGVPALGQVLPVNLHMLLGAWTLGTSLLVLIRVIDVYGLPTDERVAPLLEGHAPDADEGDAPAGAAA